MSARTKWPLRRLKYVCSVNPPAPKVPDTQAVSFVPMEALQQRGGIDANATRTAGAVRQGYTGFQDDDVVIAKITPCFENGKGSLVTGMKGGVGFGTTELHVLRAQNSDPRWLFYITQSHHFMGYGEGSMYGAGGQKRVPPDFVQDYRAQIPPLPTQKAIANFLDKKTQAIDSLIEKKQQLLALLDEKRAAVINQAVTKGLDPGVPMKDSGIAWIGEIPGHWEMTRLKFVIQFSGGFAFKSSDFGVAGIPVVRMSDLKSGQLDLENAVRVPAEVTESSATLESRDLLVGMSGSLTNYAVVRSSNLPAQLNQRVGRIRPTISLMDHDFLILIIQSREYAEPVQLEATTTAVPNISPSSIRNIFVALPALEEQRQIVKTTSKMVSQLDGTKGVIERQLHHLQEYRQALITAAVTGQLTISEEAS